MNTITIDHKLYNEAILYADQKRMSVSGLFEYAVRKFMELNPVKTRSSVLDSDEYKKALEAMDEIKSWQALYLTSIPAPVIPRRFMFLGL